MNTSALPRLALIAGPTASGKSALALDLAREHDGVIVNADSAQVYRDLRVLTARPSQEEEAMVPHRLFGYLDATETCSAARWAADARAAIAAIHAEDRLPILVGGTGLYLRALLDGIAPVPPIDPTIRAGVRAMPVAEAHAALSLADPPAAARLAPADTTRVARALEVIRSTGRPLAAWQEARTGGIGDAVSLASVLLIPDRETLFARCDARLAAMFVTGAIEEVAALSARRDLPPDAPIRRAIGVRPIAAFLSGTIGEAEALALARTETRQYAKRQLTWFRRQSPADWAKVEESSTAAPILATLLRFKVDEPASLA